MNFKIGDRVKLSRNENQEEAKNFRLACPLLNSFMGCEGTVIEISDYYGGRALFVQFAHKSPVGCWVRPRWLDEVGKVKNPNFIKLSEVMSGEKFKHINYCGCEVILKKIYFPKESLYRISMNKVEQEGYSLAVKDDGLIMVLPSNTFVEKV